jgi:peptidoglycan/xylan/chitin deacetylase (PgdA/CDA1 family)
MRRYSAIDSALIRLVCHATRRTRAGGMLAVMTFHRVLQRKDPIIPSEPDRAEFAALMDLVCAHFNVLPLSEGVALLRERRAPPRAVSITFDDGYANNCAVALPILAERRIPATVFVATGFLDGGWMFNDRVIEAVRRAPPELDLRDIGLASYRLTDDLTRARVADQIIRALKHRPASDRERTAHLIASRSGLPRDSGLMMTRDQVRQLHGAGIDIGAHTVSHPILTALQAEDARREIIDGKSQLEAIIGAPVTLFAFPNGRPGVDYDRRHVDMVAEAGFVAGFSTAWGAADANCDFMQMPRIAPWGRTPLRYALQIVASFRQRDYQRV